jgi:hypothetical protein
MLQFAVFLEVVRQRLRDKIQPKIRGDNYYVIAGGLALVYALGTALTGLFALTPGMVYLVPVMIFGVFCLFTIILAPFGLLLL